MRVLLANKYWYLRGGAERYGFELKRLLERNGDEVVPFAMHAPQNEATVHKRFFVSPVHTESLRFGWQGLRTAGRMLWSFEAARKFRALAEETKPDVLHVQNIYHQISPSILAAARKLGLPAVMTLHDYHLVSPNYAMFDYVQERIRRPWPKHPYLGTLLRREIDGSWIKSALSGFEGWLHHALRAYGPVRTFIAPSAFMKDVCAKYGVPAERIEVVPHFIDLAGKAVTESTEPRVVFVGRLSREKGVDVLLRAMREVPGLRCLIVGDGPDRGRLEGLASAMKLGNVAFAGALRGEALDSEIRRALAMVAPSIWEEVFGLVILEAYAWGKPVVASRVGGLPEVVRDGETGFLFEPGDAFDLADKLTRLLENPDDVLRMGLAGRKLAETEYAPGLHLGRIHRIYKEAMTADRAR